jgi:predicted nucleic acid-binding protein
MRLLIDTDVLIDHLRGARRLSPDGSDIGVSVVTRAELYAGRHADESRIDMLLERFQEYPVERAIAVSAGRLARAAGIPIPDALIAATAMEHGLTLLTRNRRHFDRVAGLQIRSDIGSEP